MGLGVGWFVDGGGCVYVEALRQEDGPVNERCVICVQSYKTKNQK